MAHSGVKEMERVIPRVDADESNAARGVRSMQAQAHSRDDAERALTAGEQTGKVISGVVLRETREVFDDTAIRQDRFDARHL